MREIRGKIYIGFRLFRLRKKSAQHIFLFNCPETRKWEIEFLNIKLVGYE
jgi:hypothetical protein